LGTSSTEVREASQQIQARILFFVSTPARLRLPRGDLHGGLFVVVEAPKPAWFEETGDGEYARALGEAAGVVEREPTS
jgi:hypothetical protein